MKKPEHKKRTFLLFALLAVLCIGSVELAACSWFAPDRYQAIMAPVRRTVRAAGDGCLALARLTGRALLAYGEYAAQCLEQVRLSEEYSWQDIRRIEEARSAPPPTPSDSLTVQSPAPVPAQPPPLTELRTEDGRDILTGGITDIVYFNQAEDPWADAPYGTDTLRKYGCGPTTMAMVVASLTQEESNPALMAQWAVQHGHWASRSGSYHSIVRGAAEAYGLSVRTPVEQTAESLYSALESGELLVALMRPGHFTDFGHFILLRGVTPNGNILVADPNSVANSLASWDPQLILDELAASNSNGAPLWAVSQPQT